MRTNQYTEIARAIITHGHPIAIGWYDDGDAESGPRGGTLRGYRWGQLTVTMELNQARAYVESRKAGDGPWGKGTGYPLVWGATSDESVIDAIRASWRD